jgi:3-oxoacyl-[acyl-carrier protein] reductase
LTVNLLVSGHVSDDISRARRASIRCDSIDSAEELSPKVFHQKESGLNLNLARKTAIVTGSGSGLGAAYALALARAGAAVIVNDVSAEAAARTTDAISAAGGRAVTVVAPVGSSAVAQQLVDAAVAEFGGLDILVTNAGILRDKSLLKMTDDDFDQVLEVHLRGTFTCVRSAYAHFKDNKVAGRIITIGSPTGQRGNFGQTNYAAAKAGIVGMVRTWALEMARAGVGVNTVVPVAATAMTRTVPYFAAAIEAADAGRPMPDFYRKDLGFGTAADVAGLVVFLASEAAAGITGQVFGVGGDRLQLWSHPEPVISVLQDGGWTADAIASQFESTLGKQVQTVGEDLPPLPAEHQRASA